MVLDCTAYSNVSVLPDDPSRECDRETCIPVFAYADFARSTRGLVDHDKKSDDGRFIAEHDYDITNSKSFGWRAGSYSGYGRFRDSLSEISGWRQAGDPEELREQPFFELVWFADNEGCIGHEAAADLLADFQTYRDAYRAKHGDAWWSEVYDEWIKGLTLAADHGLVSFH